MSYLSMRVDALSSKAKRYNSVLPFTLFYSSQEPEWKEPERAPFSLQKAMSGIPYRHQSRELNSIQDPALPVFIESHSDLSANRTHPLKNEPSTIATTTKNLTLQNGL